MLFTDVAGRVWWSSRPTSRGGSFLVALCTPPRGLVTSAVPPEWWPTVAAVLADAHPGLLETTGSRDRAEAFALAWSL
ncbi:MAG: hypothetical protein ACRDT0_11535 [Pseudonocardiaceae bacterium]